MQDKRNEDACEVKYAVPSRYAMYKVGGSTLKDDRRGMRLMLYYFSRHFTAFRKALDNIVSTNKTALKEIVSIMLRGIIKRTARQMDLKLTVEEDASAFLVEKGYDEKYGARPLRRAIQNHLEDKLAEAILDGTIRGGDQVSVRVEDGSLKFLTKELINS